MICQNHLPLKPWLREQTRRLPGLCSISMDKWLVMDEVFRQQMVLRDDLIKTHLDRVYAFKPNVDEDGRELLKCVLMAIAQNKLYHIDGDKVLRPDGVQIELDWQHPVLSAGRLVQEDFLLLKPEGRQSAHHIKAGILCFPAGWRLSDKMARPIFDVHKGITEYHHDMANRVERILHNLLPDKLVMRANYLVYTNPDLHQPNEEGVIKSINEGAPRFVRVERQTLRKLPESKAIVFSIHTYIVPALSLSKHDYAALMVQRPELDATSL